MGFFDKLKQGLFKTKNAIVGKVDELFKKFIKVDEDLFDELEELLISADIGVNTTEEILDELRDTVKDKRIKEPAEVKSELFEILKRMIGEHEPLNLSTKPSVILVIGVNGVGKTTSIGKISAELKRQGKKVVVAAADTFRAAAAEQLNVWWRIKPDFDTHDLQWARDTVPTPHGVICVAWEKQGNDVTLSVTLPCCKIDAEICLPNGETHRQVDQSATYQITLS